MGNGLRLVELEGIISAAVSTLKSNHSRLGEPGYRWMFANLTTIAYTSTYIETNESTTMTIRRR